MNVSRALARACLSFLGGALLLVAALLVVFVVVQHLRADAGAQPATHLIAALVSTALALPCRLTVRKRM